MRTFVMGDIHGNFKGLKQVLERSGFDYDNDTLIQLGDVADGWTEVYECVDELLNIRNLISIKGNHDDWFAEYLKMGIHPVKWKQGAWATAESYLRQIGKEHLVHQNGDGYTVALNPDDVPPLHQKFFRDQHLYYIDDKNRCFVHGGFNRHMTMKENQGYIFYWDRDLWMAALSYGTMRSDSDGLHGKTVNKFKMKDNFEEVFIGHTATVNWKRNVPDAGVESITTPMHAANVWNLDTGSGFAGKLTIMDVDTKEYWQSDLVNELYSHESGRVGKR